MEPLTRRDTPLVPAPAVGEHTAKRAAQRVLIVDDQPDSANMLGLLLQAHGFDVRVEIDPHKALNAFDAFSPAVMLLDLGMPGMDGITLARCVRGRLDGGSVTLIALTGWSQEEDRRRCKEAGIDHHLVKPVDFGLLRQLLADTAMLG